MKKFLVLFTLISVFLLSGCVSFQVPQPLPKENKIGIISNYRPEAEFRYVGTTAFNDVFYNHALPNLDVKPRCQVLTKDNKLVFSNKFIFQLLTICLA